MNTKNEEEERRLTTTKIGERFCGGPRRDLEAPTKRRRRSEHAALGVAEKISAPTREYGGDTSKILLGLRSRFVFFSPTRAKWERRRV
ncbi:unnamed protein product [Microthlaspi erraticum]|uniref:Uncharacterized protein n=1 Tax=Microthlaspi erraticum TaxID=1685480 RepID=A0A6D2HM31_9BRAS|nr:unnamed protein product [Microthlaspi erraticum]